MAFRTAPTLADGFSEAILIARSIRLRWAGIRTQLNSDVSGRTMLREAATLAQQHDRLTALAAVSGMQAYAQAQYDDVTYDVATEFTALLADIAAVYTWVYTNVPQVGGYYQVEEVVADELVERTFAPAITAPLAALVDTLVASIST